MYILSFLYVIIGLLLLHMCDMDSVLVRRRPKCSKTQDTAITFRVLHVEKRSAHVRPSACKYTKLFNLNGSQPASLRAAEIGIVRHLAVVDVFRKTCVGNSNP